MGCRGVDGSTALRYDVVAQFGQLGDAMDIAELATRTGLPTRRLRYIFDHDVLPGAGDASEGRGIPRSLTAFEAFGVALAALLLESGLKRRLVAACLHETCGRFTRATVVKQIPLYQAFGATSAWLEVGDGRFYRLHGVGRRGVGPDFDTGWQSLDAADSVPGPFAPLVVVRIDLAGLRQMVGD